MTNSAHQSIGDLAIKSFENLIDRTEKYRKKAADNSDPELVHQLRVSLRKIRAALAFFGPVVIFAQELTDKKIASVAKDFGKKRDNDVLHERFKEVTLGLQGDNPFLRKVDGAFDKQDKKATKQIERALSSKKLKKVIEGLEAWVKEPELTLWATESAGTAIGSLLEDAAIPVTSHDAWQIVENIDLERNIETLFGEAGKTVHDLRKKVKRLRYAIEFTEPITGTRFDNILLLLKAIQDHLGTVQDMRILKEFLDKSLGSIWMDELPGILHNILATVRSNMFETKQIGPNLQRSLSQAFH